MKATTKKVEDVTNVANPTEKKDSPILSSEELFNVEGGEDVDLDEDYLHKCINCLRNCKLKQEDTKQVASS